MNRLFLAFIHCYILTAINTCGDIPSTMKNEEPKTPSPTNAIFEKWTDVSPDMKAPISNDSAVAAARIQDKFPAFRDSAGVGIEGYFFNSADFAALIKLPQVSALYFRMGISNFGDSVGIANGTIKPKYTIIVYPLDANRNKLLDAAGNPIAFDYVCPCPAIATCCPRR
ncbi:MAG: hypothetical protein QM802_22950 [Agriterribacter sp.]